MSKRAHRWLTVRHFGTTGECVAALRAEGIAIWATTLREGARSLALGPVLHGGDPAGLLEALPKGRLAVVMGSEAEGISAEMAAAADEVPPPRVWGVGGGSQRGLPGPLPGPLPGLPRHRL